MPIPKPKANETRSKFISRCMSFLGSEGGRTQNVMLGICYSAWKEKDEVVMKNTDEAKLPDAIPQPGTIAGPKGGYDDGLDNIVVPENLKSRGWGNEQNLDDILPVATTKT